MDVERWCVCVCACVLELRCTISDEQAKLRKENEELRMMNACLDRENEEYASNYLCC